MTTTCASVFALVVVFLRFSHTKGEAVERSQAASQEVVLRKGRFEGGTLVAGLLEHGHGWRFEGEFSRGYPHLGRLTHLRTGNFYVGQFRGFREHGKGTFHIVAANDCIECDTWMDGQMQGPGSYRWGTGSVLSGIYEDGRLKDGVATYRDCHGWELTCQFQGGIPTGPREQNLPPTLRDCVARGHCTYTKTGKERFGQVYWKKVVDQYVRTMPGYCVTCQRTCFPHHRAVNEGHEFMWAFSGNFYCLCGSGEMGLDANCLAGNH